jgi:hypothetical protein
MLAWAFDAQIDSQADRQAEQQADRQTVTRGLQLSLSGRGRGIPMVGVILLTHVLIIISSILFILPVLCSLIPLDHIHLQQEYAHVNRRATQPL